MAAHNDQVFTVGRAVGGDEKVPRNPPLRTRGTIRMFAGAVADDLGGGIRSVVATVFCHFV